MKRRPSRYVPSYDEFVTVYWAQPGRPPRLWQESIIRALLAVLTVGSRATCDGDGWTTLRLALRRYIEDDFGVQTIDTQRKRRAA